MTTSTLSVTRSGVADGGHIDSGWLAAILIPLGAVLTGLGAWLGPRLMGKAAFQEALNHGFKTIMDQMATERTASQAAIAELRDDLDHERVSGQIRAEKIRQLEGEVRDLKQANASLRNQLDRQGLTSVVTPNAVRDRPVENLVELPATKGPANG